MLRFEVYAARLLHDDKFIAYTEGTVGDLLESVKADNGRESTLLSLCSRLTARYY